MQIAELIPTRKPFFSLEFFPPKERETWPRFFAEVEKLKAVNPLFVSVTYGAGGGTQANTLDVVTHLKRELDLEPMAHLTCVGASSAALRGFLEAISRAGIDNVLALRGDPPKNNPDFRFEGQEFQHASDLVRFIRTEFPAMGIGVAGIPTMHPESASLDDDLKWVRHKVDAGGQFVVSQLFFENELFLTYVKRLRERGVTVPVLPGVMPILSMKSAEFIATLNGRAVFGGFYEELERAFAAGGDEAVRALGLARAVAQVQGLIDAGVPGVHLYTLNRAEACLAIVDKITFP
ncbi:5,10-methylenetetrahydrofolate reductase (NAD(P)) [Humidesulfovibrio mexicanus]|uniref:Methylenetetrahydrofolate reductase n=1 Tax=Humidesulfovibrio mexicanus TaxID=147047 RepID=A0A239BJV6_9BACT|nr:methylenetetrahydrofolate reductase [Humidesulfovibrio mexicanus]SNS08136.1 5,10-methylenetetrahydrofolate reductase (NAD(P)) [Humidesulfovibrio mexicanus]